MGVHQSDETPCHPPVEYMGGMYDSLYRQYTADGRVHHQVEAHLEALIYLLTGLGFVINIPKSITIPTQQIEFLGLQMDSTCLQLSLPGEKLHYIRMEINQNLQRSQVTARQLAQLIGKLHATSLAVLPAPLFYWSLQGDLQKALDCSNQDYDTLLSISPPAQMVAGEALPIQWQGFDSQNNNSTVIIRSDASLQGWGAVCNGTRTGGCWSHLEQGMHINCLELLAATLKPS